MRGEMGKALLKFAASSAAIFALLWLRPSWYLVPLAHATSFLLGIAGKVAMVDSVEGLAFFLRYEGQIFRISSRFILLGLPVLVALFAATPRLDWRLIWKWLVAAVAILFVQHAITAMLVFYMIIGGLAQTTRLEPLEILMLVFVAVNKLLPVILWFAIAGKDVVLRPSRRPKRNPG